MHESKRAKEITNIKIYRDVQNVGGIVLLVRGGSYTKSRPKNTKVKETKSRGAHTSPWLTYGTMALI